MTFKVTQLVLDDNEDVATVVVKLDAKSCRVASEFLGADLSIKPDPDAETRTLPGTDVSGVRPVEFRGTAFAHIPRNDAVRLFQAVGKVNGNDPVYEVTKGMYTSILNVMVMLDNEW